MTDKQQLASELEELLLQREVTGVARILTDLGEDANLEACVAAVGRYDREGKSSPGLLVWIVKEAAVAPPVPEQKKAPKAQVTPRLLRAIRGSCNSPNGFTREEARGMFAVKAGRLNRPVDELINLAMGADWQETKPHPAFDPEHSREDRQRAYFRLLQSPDVVRKLEEIEL